LSAAMGVATTPRNGGGRQAPADEAICQVMLLYNGSLVIGADTDPRQLPQNSTRHQRQRTNRGVPPDR